MICPKCGGQMNEMEFKGVQLNKCSGCEGLWFNNLEHEVLKKIRGSAAIDTGAAIDGARNDSIDSYKCPNCSGSMVRLVDKEQPHIWYEVCHSCFGVYFDAGEFRDYQRFSLSDLLGSFINRERE